MSARPIRNRRSQAVDTSVILALALFAASAVGCARDSVGPAAPPFTRAEGDAHRSTLDENSILVGNSAELVAALSQENAGRRIQVRAGDYELTQPLTVPDGVTLVGAGDMMSDGAGLPIGFAVDTRSTLRMTANVPGDILTLGNGVTIRGLAIEDLAGRAGNAIAVLSRRPGDRVSATIADIEILNPNTHGVLPSGPIGCGVAVLTLNPSLGSDPPPHAGADVGATVTHSLIRSPATGTGCGIFAFNFAPAANVSLELAHSVVGGGIIAAGGVSRPDAVHDSRTVIESRGNLYRDDSADPCASRRLGWNIQGGSGIPTPLPVPATTGNSLRLFSLGDRVEGFTKGIVAIGSRRFFAQTAGPSDGNSVDLQLLGTRIVTPQCGPAIVVADLVLAGAQAAGAFAPGDNNKLHALLLEVTGSGARSNTYADVLGPDGAVSGPLLGTGNRLELAGSVEAFTQSNRSIDPMPGAEFFTGGMQ